MHRRGVDRPFGWRGNARGREENRDRGVGGIGAGLGVPEEDVGRRGRGNQDFRGRRGRGRGGGNDGRRYEMGYRQLAELQNKDPSTIVMALGLDSGLQPLLNRTSITSDVIYLVARVLAESCKCTSAPENVIRILLTVVQSEFNRHVMKELQGVSYSPREKEREKRQFIKDLLTFMMELAIRLPHSYMTTQMLGLENYLDMVVAQLQLKSEIIDEDLLAKKAELQDIKTTVLEKVARKGQERETEQGPPPSDFRDIPIFPNVVDIHPDEKPYLRKNIAVGGYKDLEHYLDVQFRLLREDFVAPLRDGIAEYQEAEVPGHRKQQLKDIRVYHDVHVIRTVCSDGGLLHRLAFDVSRLSGVRWENSKRLIFGSLVCLSDNNFETLLFATVSDRDPKKLIDGLIDVSFENVDDMDDDIFSINTQFVMVETSAYFEAYRHVLKALQMIRAGHLPFEKYIVSCVTEVEPSKYLRMKPTSKYDLRPLVDENMILNGETALRNMLRLQGREVLYDWSKESRCAQDVEVLDNREWPSAEQLHLDSSQYRAVKTALTKEFVIIQGPPGTGKTYVGLKIVKALLHNSKMWSDGDTSPMLIVCYTNHALDQFMEGIVSYFKGDVIRVGGRMKSEVLEKCSMKAQRQKARKTDSTRDMRTTGRMRWQIRETMMTLKLAIEKIGLQIEAADREILHEDTLRPFMEEHYDYMIMTMQTTLMNMEADGYEVTTPRSVMVELLGIGNMDDIMINVQQAAEEYVEEEDDDGDVDVQGEADIMQAQRIVEDVDDVLVGGLDQLQKRIDNLQYEKGGYIAFDVTNLDRKPNKGWNNELQFQLPPKARKQLKRRLLKRLRSGQKMSAAEAHRVRDPWNLLMDDRWKLYRYWVSCFTESLGTSIRVKELAYKQAVAQYKESQMIEDKQIMERATVIGMTTTAAARYQQVLAEIGPKIVVVEEAAEVLEGHIITTLSRKCQHLILIGDHKQLKPNPTVYKLAKQFNLDLSLFERMVNNGVHCDTLELQHRMRPEISRLMKPIYPTLKDHPSVLNCENIKGVSGNLFFINHGCLEKGDAEMRSHSNEFEAQYIVALCDYLLKQGYSKSQITVLTTYSGQLFKLKKLMPKHTFEGVKLTVVDNYQGEENDIILLSLVRSNPEGRAGFLKIENRVCVALSRAKYGLFVVGNFDMLAQDSQLWKEIVKDLKRSNEIGSSLSLYCQNHPRDDGIAAKEASDFKKAPEGGCMKLCSFRLDCGHVCSRLCHPYDPQHEEYKCGKPCAKTSCINNHPCTRLCYQDCEKCKVPVEKILPLCCHRQMVPCSVSPLKFQCEHDCAKILPCGHKCGNPCGKEHQCTEIVKKTWRCGHALEVQCMTKDAALCRAKCPESLKCGHRCQGNCHDCHEGRLHIPCRMNCKRILVCGHECEDRCSYCPPCTKQCQNRCTHSKCYKICGDVCVPCREPCQWECIHNKCTKRCSEPCNRPACNEPCTKLLNLCRHPCIGLCGEPCPQLCRICDKDEVTTIMFGTEDEPDARFVELEDCRHIIEVSALDHYMEMKTDSETIQLKGCPRCKTPIRRNVRYGSLIKGMLKDVDSVKIIQTGKTIRIRELAVKLEIEADSERDSEERSEKQNMIKSGYRHTESGLNAIENQFRFLKRLSKLFDAYEKLGKECRDVNGRTILTDVLSHMKELERFRKWMQISRFSLSEQEESDAQNELLRHRAIVRLLRMEKLAESRELKCEADIIRDLNKLKAMLKYGKPYTDARQTEAMAIFEILKKLIPESGLGITEDEKVEVLKAMGLQKGHWFKCLNGHIYAIGDCGGATVEGKCPECKATIGGASHNLRADNSLAPEMDGARHAAWSELGNVENFDNLENEF